METLKLGIIPNMCVGMQLADVWYCGSDVFRCYPAGLVCPYADEKSGFLIVFRNKPVSLSVQKRLNMKTNREEILQNALQLFMSKNYEGVSLQMIAHSVGLTKTGIFNYYPTKLDLFIAVADRYLFHLQDPENKFAPSDGSLRDFIDKYVEGVERTMAEIVRLGNIQREKMPGELANAGYFHLFQQVLFYYPDGKHKLHEWMEKEFRLWCDVIGRSVEHGELREEIDVQETAALFRQVFIGLSYQMSFSDGLDVGILRKRFLYIYGLLKR